MRLGQSLWCPLVIAMCGTESAWAAPASGSVRLAPHRVVYELSLVSSRSVKGIEAARGRIAFEMTGNACNGYTLRYRQLMVVEGSETGSKVTDVRTANFESADGRTFRFRNDVKLAGSHPQIVDGQAERRGNSRTTVTLRSPKRQTVPLGPDVVFPNAQMRDIITAARDGQTSVAIRLFDGSDDGRKLYETLAIIGKRVEGVEAPEPATRQAGLQGLARWPVTLSYFDRGREDQTASYILSFDLYENGVSRALRLDYGDFALKGEMTRLDLLSEGSCSR